jgi:hypothetical protein
MYTSNKEVYRRFGDYYVSVVSDDRILEVSKDSLVKSSVYTVQCPELTEQNRVSALPDVELPDDYIEITPWRLPEGVEEILLSSSKDDRSFAKNGWYFNYNFRYQKNKDAISDAASRVVALSKQPLDWWWKSGDTFICKAGDEFACVKQINYTSCYFISCNDLAYLLLNIQEES